MNNIVIENTQFKLYYLLIAVDGEITDEEKDVFIKIVSELSDYTKSYAESLFKTIDSFKSTINYDYIVKTLSSCSDEIKNQTIEVLKKLSYADGSYQKEEQFFITKLKKDLNVKKGE